MKATEQKSSMKVLSAFNQSTIALKFVGKVFVYVAVTDPHFGAALGLAVANEHGYTPVPSFWSHSRNYHEMSAHADELNAALGYTKEQALDIITSTKRRGS